MRLAPAPAKGHTPTLGVIQLRCVHRPDLELPFLKTVDIVVAKTVFDSDVKDEYMEYTGWWRCGLRLILGSNLMHLSALSIF